MGNSIRFQLTICSCESVGSFWDRKSLGPTGHEPPKLYVYVYVYVYEYVYVYAYAYAYGYMYMYMYGAKAKWQWGRVGWMLADHRDGLLSSSL